MDQALGNLGLFHVRFMDDIVVLAPTRWKLRAAVKALNQAMGALWLAKHPGKTFIGRIEKGPGGGILHPAVLLGDTESQ